MSLHLSILEVIMRRDGLSKEEAQDMIDDAKSMVEAGADPEELCYTEFGLEPDYMWDLMP